MRQCVQPSTSVYLGNLLLFLCILSIHFLILFVFKLNQSLTLLIPTAFECENNHLSPYSVFESTEHLCVSVLHASTVGVFVGAAGHLVNVLSVKHCEKENSDRPEIHSGSLRHQRIPYDCALNMESM